MKRIFMVLVLVFFLCVVSGAAEYRITYLPIAGFNLYRIETLCGNGRWEEYMVIRYTDLREARKAAKEFKRMDQIRKAEKCMLWRVVK
jgi:hypothetical protein